MKGGVNNDRHNNCTEDTDQGALRIDRDWRQGDRREGNNGDNDTFLHHWLRFDFEGKFHYQGKWWERERKKRAQGKVLEETLVWEENNG